MRTTRAIAALLAAFTVAPVLAPTPVAAAETVTISGGLYFQALFTPNYFDPANGYVVPEDSVLPPVQRTVDIEVGAVSDAQYDFNDQASRIIVDLVVGSSGASVTIQDAAVQSAYEIYMVFSADKPIFSINPYVPPSFNPFADETRVADDGRTLFIHAPATEGASNRHSVIFQGISSVSSVASALPNGAVAAAAVPEPATWALMVVAFGMVGAAMRRRGRSGSARAALA